MRCVQRAFCNPASSQDVEPRARDAFLENYLCHCRDSGVSSGAGEPRYMGMTSGVWSQFFCHQKRCAHTRAHANVMRAEA
jgi:hypothetical protein